MTSDEIIKIRRQEELASASVLGITSVDFVGIGDGVSQILLVFCNQFVGITEQL